MQRDIERMSERRTKNRSTRKLNKGVRLNLDDAIRLHDEGNRLIRQGNYKRAIECFVMVIRGNYNLSLSPTPHHNLGRAYVKDGNYNSAIKSYTMAINLYSEPNYWLTGSYINRGLAYAARCLESDKYKAIEDFDNAVRLCLESYEAAFLLNRANGNYSEGQIERAMEILAVKIGTPP